MPVSKAGWREVDLAEKIEQLNAQQGHRTASAYPTRPRQYTEGTFLLRICLQEGEKMTSTYLEKRFNMRPAGVVSKKLIGERKIAKAILSWSFREAWPKVGGGVSDARQD
jgi:hypothetical protein